MKSSFNWLKEYFKCHDCNKPFEVISSKKVYHYKKLVDVVYLKCPKCNKYTNLEIKEIKDV